MGLQKVFGGGQIGHHIARCNRGWFYLRPEDLQYFSVLPPGGVQKDRLMAKDIGIPRHCLSANFSSRLPDNDGCDDKRFYADGQEMTHRIGDDGRPPTPERLR